VLWPQYGLYDDYDNDNDDLPGWRWTCATSAGQTSSLPPTGGARPVGAVDRRWGLRDFNLTIFFIAWRASVARDE